MPRLVTVLLFTMALFVSLTIIGCQKKSADPSQMQRDKDKIQVFVSIMPQMSIVKSIGGDHVQVESLVKANTSPHNYEPTPRQLMRLTQAHVFFSINMPFEDQLLSKIQLQNSSLHIANMAENIVERHFITSDARDHDAHDSHDETVDPHVWLGVAQIETLANTTTRRLSELYPQFASDFNANLLKYLAKLHAVNDSLHTALDQYRGSSFYVFHPAFGYFADSYGLKQVAVEIEGKSPSAKQILSVIELAKHDNVKILFVQKQFDSNTAQAIAKAIDGTVVAIDPLLEDILQNLQMIGTEILQSFKNQVG